MLTEHGQSAEALERRRLQARTSSELRRKSANAIRTQISSKKACVPCHKTLAALRHDIEQRQATRCRCRKRARDCARGDQLLTVEGESPPSAMTATEAHIKATAALSGRLAQYRLSISRHTARFGSRCRLHRTGLIRDAAGLTPTCADTAIIIGDSAAVNATARLGGVVTDQLQHCRRRSTELRRTILRPSRAYFLSAHAPFRSHTGLYSSVRPLSPIVTERNRVP